MNDVVEVGKFLFGGVGLLVGAWLIRRWRASSRRVPTFRHPTMEELRPEVTLLVIDDAEFEYKGLLRKQGFRVLTRPDVDTTRDIESGEFDAVLLDLHGVGTKISDDQGIGVLRQIKAGSPAQVVVAYSSAPWTLAMSHEAGGADQLLDKATSTFSDFRQAVEVKLLESNSLDFYVEHLQLLCPGTPRRDIERALSFYIADSENPARLSDLEKAVRSGPDIGNRTPQVHAIAALAAKRLRRWMS